MLFGLFETPSLFSLLVLPLRPPLASRPALIPWHAPLSTLVRAPLPILLHLCCKHPISDQASCPLGGSFLGLSIRGWSCPLSSFGAVSCSAALVGQSKPFSCPSHLVLAFLSPTRAILNLLCSSHTLVLLYRENGGMELELPAHVCRQCCLPPPSYLYFVLLFGRHRVDTQECV